MTPSIRYLRHDDIDPDKWDECIDNASNGLIYGYSHYLDRLAKHWDGLVLGDYEAVMPLPWNKKLGIPYLYQPAFVATGGVFGNQLDGNIVNNFIAAIPKKFKLIEINLNAGNRLDGAHLLRDNYVLSLNAPYEELYKNYRENIKRNIRRAQQLGCTVQSGIPVKDIIKIAKEQLQPVVKIPDHVFQQFEEIYEILHQARQAVTYGVFSAAGQLIASCACLLSHNRIYYLLVGNHPNGKTSGASHYLIDRLIADTAGSNKLLDFEGSDIPGLAFFYSSFGAKQEVYPFVSINNLPWYIRIFKR